MADPIVTSRDGQGGLSVRIVGAVAAPGSARRERAPPARLLRGQREHPQVARLARQKRLPILVGIAPGRMRALVDEALDDEPRVQPTQGHPPTLDTSPASHLVGQPTRSEGIDDRSFDAKRGLFVREAMGQDVDLGRLKRAT